MKKIAVLLAVVLLVSMLGGCYKSDVVFDFGVGGDVEITSTVVAPAETYAQMGFPSLDQHYNDFGIDAINEKIENPDEKIKLERVDASGNVLPEGTQLPTDGSMVGTRMRAKYETLSAAKNSMVFQHNLMITPLTKDESGYGLEVQEKHGLIGTKYVVSGKIHVQGSEMHQLYSAQLVEANPNVLDAASSTVTFKFPLCYGKNGDKSFVGTSLSYGVTKDAPQTDVYFEVTVLNPLVLGMAIAILVLLAIILVLVLKKKKDTPDAFFVDADGNEIPVFDVEDTEDEGEEAILEATDIEEIEETEALEEAEETEENNE